MQKVEHLVLLVGSNPLPNAVASQLLVEEGGCITLVHSKGTAKIADSLERWIKAFKQGGSPEVYKSEVDESSPADIQNRVKQALNNRQRTSVGLNYTGGTKVMAVHAYRAVQEWAVEHNTSPVFSYLDARTLEMVFERFEAHPEQRVFVGRSIELQIKDFLDLHSWKTQSSYNREPFLPESAAALAQVSTDSNCLTIWRNWLCCQLRCKARRDDDKAWKSITQLAQVQLELPQNDCLKLFGEKLRSELRLSPDAESIWLSKEALGQDPEKLCEWLDGVWLESYVLTIVKSLRDDLSLSDFAQSVKTEAPQFEVDVVAVWGYQLFVFSCSTDSKKGQLKLKLFEAYVRARQLGGDEARVALVCLHSEPHLLEQEMQRDFAVEGQIKVFGQPHLGNLREHIREWILNQGGRE